MADPEPRSLPELQRTHKLAPRSRIAAPHGEADEHSAVRNYVRDLILGFNDGLVSVYAVTAGVAGAVAGATGDVRTIAIAGTAAGVAGALSMGLGEYLSTKSQSEYYASEAQREREHIRKYPKLEREEVLDMLAKKDYPPELVKPIADHVIGDEDRFVDFMMREEFGVGEESDRSPFVAMGLVMLAFVVGALIPLAPYFLAHLATTALAASTILALVGLFTAGSIKNVTAGLAWWKGGLEMMALGAVAAVITYGVGHLFHVSG